jgi:hypothetical protein
MTQELTKKEKEELAYLADEQIRYYQRAMGASKQDHYRERLAFWQTVHKKLTQ